MTIDDVARRSGVSVATVSRAVRGLPNVSPVTRQRVLAAAEELRYRPDPNAARLAAGKTGLVVMAVPSITAWYLGQAVSGVEAVLSTEGLDLSVVFISDAETRAMALHEPGLLAHGADGLILLDVAPDAEAVESPVPIVVVGMSTPRFDSVAIDNHAAGVLVGRHLAMLDHRNVALIGGSTEEIGWAVGSERLAGFKKGFSTVAGACAPPVSFGNFSALGGYEAMVQLLESHRPSAVFAVSDDMAMGAYRAVHDHGGSVPLDVSLVGFDDTELAFAIGLTTVAQDPVDLGAQGAHQLVRRLNGDLGPPANHRGEVRLVVRESTTRWKNSSR